MWDTTSTGAMCCTTCANASHELRVQEERTHDWRKNTIRKRAARSCQDFPIIPNVILAHLVGRNVATIMRTDIRLADVPQSKTLLVCRSEDAAFIQLDTGPLCATTTATSKHQQCQAVLRTSKMSQRPSKTGPDHDCPKFLRESKSVKLPRTPSV